MSAQVSYSETIVPRENLDFGLDASIPKYWYRGDAYKSRYVDAVQLSFPDGERYFITCVRAFRDQITDPTLQVAVRDFTRQEGQHGMAHTRYNKLLEAQGLPIESLLDQIKALIARRMRIYSPQFNLALTAAAEHFTAMLAEAFFAKVSTTEGMHPRMRAMLAWHAIEEMEHKSVAFDVMRTVAKVGYWKRVAAMVVFTKDILGISYSITNRMLKADGCTGPQRLWLHLKNIPWIHSPRKGVFGSLTPKLLAYFKPGFHPNDQPVIHNYRSWVDTYERTGSPALACEALLAAAYR